MTKIFNTLLYLTKFLENILFYEVYGFPILIIGLISGFLFFSFYLKFPAIKYLKKSLKSISGADESGEGGLLKSKQSLFTSLASVVGVGCIAGVATAIYVGGAGSIFWIVITAIFSTNMSFAENLLAAKYKNVNEKEKTVECAPVSYIRGALKDLKLKKFGLILSSIYAFLYFMGLLGTQTYQIGETVNLLTEFEFLANYKILIAAIFDITILCIIYGGITKIASVFDKLLPAVCGLYIISVCIILLFNITKIPMALLIIIKEAFKIKSITGGIIGALCTGIKRGVYCTEAGLGSSTTPYAAMKADNPIKQAMMGSLNPILVSLLCLFTGLAIVVSGVYLKTDSGNGIVLTKNAFDTVSPWFSYVLTMVISLLTLSVCISSAFNAENVYLHCFGKKTLFIYFIMQFTMLMGGAFFKLDEVISIADTLYLSIAVPNLICMFIVRKTVKEIYLDNKNYI